MKHKVRVLCTMDPSQFGQKIVRVEINLPPPTQFEVLRPQVELLSQNLVYPLTVTVTVPLLAQETAGAIRVQLGDQTVEVCRAQIMIIEN